MINQDTFFCPKGVRIREVPLYRDTHSIELKVRVRDYNYTCTCTYMLISQAFMYNTESICVCEYTDYDAK